MKSYDFVIAGAGIVGLTIARALAKRRCGSILVLEKEATLGCHASGRNSGVLHAGIYYEPSTLKAKVCVEGARMLLDYASQNNIRFRKSGKVIVASDPVSVSSIDTLYERAVLNGVQVEKISPSRLKEIEPEAQTIDQALFSPNTAVIDAHQVLSTLEKEIGSLGVQLVKSSPVYALQPDRRVVQTKNDYVQYGHFINAAGLHADRIAHWMGVGKQYRIMPFKGIYRKLRPVAAKRFRGSIYPVPNLKMPFLGVHLTKTASEDVLVGPTAIPAFGRENYGTFDGLSLKESPIIIRMLLQMVAQNQDGFLNLVKVESMKFLGNGFLKRVQSLAPSIKSTDFIPGEIKVGLRAQLVDCRKMRLEMDFVLESGSHSTHILNAISPAFTASFAFANLVVDRLTA